MENVNVNLKTPFGCILCVSVGLKTFTSTRHKRPLATAWTLQPEPARKRSRTSHALKKRLASEWLAGQIATCIKRCQHVVHWIFIAWVLTSWNLIFWHHQSIQSIQSTLISRRSCPRTKSLLVKDAKMETPPTVLKFNTYKLCRPLVIRGVVDSRGMSFYFQNWVLFLSHLVHLSVPKGQLHSGAGGTLGRKHSTLERNLFKNSSHQHTPISTHEVWQFRVGNWYK